MPGGNVGVSLSDITGVGSMIGGIADLVNAGSNLELQKQNLQYQKDLQNRVFEREDSSIQRRVADLRAAGLSPVLAAGSGAQSGAVISTQAPQLNLSAQDKIAKTFEGTASALALAKMKADISKTETETEAIKAQFPERVRGMALDNALKEATNPENIKMVKENLTIREQEAISSVFKSWIAKAESVVKEREGNIAAQQRILDMNAWVSGEFEKSYKSQLEKPTADLMAQLAQIAYLKQITGESGVRSQLLEMSLDDWKKAGLSEGAARFILDMVKGVGGVVGQFLK